MQKGPWKVGYLKSICYAAMEGEDLPTVDFTCPYDSTMVLVWGCLVSLVIPGSLYHGVSQLCLVSTCDFRAISARFSVHPWFSAAGKKCLGSRRCIHFMERKTWKNYERTSGGPMGSGWTKTKNYQELVKLQRHTKVSDIEYETGCVLTAGPTKIVLSFSLQLSPSGEQLTGTSVSAQLSNKHSCGMLCHLQ